MPVSKRENLPNISFGATATYARVPLSDVFPPCQQELTSVQGEATDLPRDLMDHLMHQEHHSQLWPQTADLPSTSDNQPPLCRSYSSTTAIYCDFGTEERLAYSSGKRQLRWWHNFNQMLEIVLGRYGAVSAERSEEGICGVMGVSSSDQKTDPSRELKAVQCALDLLDAIQEVCN